VLLSAELKSIRVFLHQVYALSEIDLVVFSPHRLNKLSKPRRLPKSPLPQLLPISYKIFDLIHIGGNDKPLLRRDRYPHERWKRIDRREEISIRFYVYAPSSLYHEILHQLFQSRLVEGLSSR
jgi:hypothetical protein